MSLKTNTIEKELIVDCKDEFDYMSSDNELDMQISSSPIPSKSLIENILPIKKISELALKEGNGKKPIYEIHKWWARRLSAVVRSLIVGTMIPDNATEKQFWEMFYSKNTFDLTVLDCFMGGGTSLVEAKKMGARTIGIDIDPLACFITKKELEKCDDKKIECQIEELLEIVGHKIKSYYMTEVDNIKRNIINAFWVYEVECDKCNQRFETHPHYKLNYSKKEQIVFCKNCGKVEEIGADDKSFICSDCNCKTDVNSFTYKRGNCICPSCSNKFKLTSKINGNKSLKLFAVEYEKDFQRIFKKADSSDMDLYRQVEKTMEESIKNYFIPNTIIPTENRENTRPMSHGYIYYKDLFNGRQLLSLAMLFDEIVKIKDINLREWFIIAFSDCLASNNILCNYAYGYKKLTPLFGIHAYTVPVRPVENNVWGSGTYGRGTFEKTIKKVLRAKKYCEKVYECKINSNGKVIKEFTGESIESKVTGSANEFYSGEYDSLITNSSSEHMDFVNDKSVELILSDPPYYDNINYSELADFYYQWIKGHIVSNYTNPIQEALYVNNNDGDSKGNYEKKLVNIFTECNKKLKDDGIMVFSYHHNKEDAWVALGNAIKEANFIVTNVLPIRSEGSSGYHTSENSIKWDSIIVLRKNMNTNIIINNGESALECKLKYWHDYIKNNELEMKACDVQSFYRSIGVMIHSLSCEISDINQLFKVVGKHMISELP